MSTGSAIPQHLDSAGGSGAVWGGEFEEEARNWLWDLTTNLNNLFLLAPPNLVGPLKGRRVSGVGPLQYFWAVPSGSPFDTLRSLVLALLDRPHLRLVETLGPVDPLDAGEADDDPDGLDAWQAGRSETLPGRQGALTNDTPEHRLLVAFLARVLKGLQNQIEEHRLLDVRREEREVVDSAHQHWFRQHRGLL